MTFAAAFSIASLFAFVLALAYISVVFRQEDLSKKSIGN
jgi:hypothetical protein